MELRTWDEVWAGILEVEEPYDDDEFRIVKEESKKNKPIIIRRK